MAKYDDAERYVHRSPTFLEALPFDELPIPHLQRIRAEAVESSERAIAVNDLRRALQYNNISYRATYRLFEVTQGSKKSFELEFLNGLMNNAYRIQKLINKSEDNA